MNNARFWVVVFFTMLSVVGSSTALSQNTIATAAPDLLYWPATDEVLHCSGASELSACDSTGACAVMVAATVTTCASILESAIPNEDEGWSWISVVNASANTYSVTTLSTDHTVATVAYGPIDTGLGDCIATATKAALTAIGDIHLLSFGAVASTVHCVYRPADNTTLYRYTTGTCSTTGCGAPAATAGQGVGTRDFNFERGIVFYLPGDEVLYSVNGRGVSVNSRYSRWYWYDDNAYAGQLFATAPGQCGTLNRPYLNTDTKATGQDSTVGLTTGGSACAGGWTFELGDGYDTATFIDSLTVNRYDTEGDALVYRTYGTATIGEVTLERPENKTIPWIVLSGIVVDNTSLSPLYATVPKFALTSGAIYHLNAVNQITITTGYGEGLEPAKPLVYAATNPATISTLDSILLSRRLGALPNGTVHDPETTYTGNTILRTYNQVWESPDMAVTEHYIGRILTSYTEGSLIRFIYKTSEAPGPAIVYATNCEHLTEDEAVSAGDTWEGLATDLQTAYATTCAITTGYTNQLDEGEDGVWSYATISGCSQSLRAVVSAGSDDEAASFNQRIVLTNDSSINVTMTDSFGTVAAKLTATRNGSTVTISTLDGQTGTVSHNEYGFLITIDAYNDAWIVTASGSTTIMLAKITGVANTMPVRAISWACAGQCTLGEWVITNPRPVSLTPTSTALTGGAPNYEYAVDGCAYREGMTVRAYYGVGAPTTDNYIEFRILSYTDREVAAAIARIPTGSNLTAAQEQANTAAWFCTEMNVCSNFARIVVAIGTMILFLVLGLLTRVPAIAAGLFALSFVGVTAAGLMPIWAALLVIIITAVGAAVYFRELLGGSTDGRV